MKNKPLNVGVIQAPDKLYKPVLYSHVQASRDFNKLDHDIYVSIKNTENTNKRKTPKAVYWALGLLTLGVGFLVFRKSFK